VTADAMNTLLAYDWPGNVRELRGAQLHQILSSADVVVPD